MKGLRQSDYRALAEFRHRIRRFLIASEEAARKSGIEPQQYLCMLSLQGLPAGEAPTVGTVAERLLLRHHSAVELVDRLERRGLVRRARGELDRREVWIRLTPRGVRMLERLARKRFTELRASGPELVRALAALVAATRRARSV